MRYSLRQHERSPPPLPSSGSAISVACSPGPHWEGRDSVSSELPLSKNPLYAKTSLIEISQVDSSISIVWNARVYAGSKNGYLYCLGN